MIDKGESKIEACAREAEEEAGVTATSLDPIYSYYPSPVAGEEVLHLYGSDIDCASLPKYAGLESEAEDIHIVILDYAEAKAKLFAGEFNVASTIIALKWLF